MLSLLRPILKLTVYLLILLTIAGGALVLFFNPDNFKSEANNILKKYSGHNFEITGPITWTFSPLMFEAQDIKLDSPNVEIKHAKVFVDMFSLLGSKPIVNSLELDGITASADKVLLPNLSSINDKLIVKSLLISNSVFAYKDAGNNQSWELRNCSANTQNLNSLKVNGTLVNLTKSLSLDLSTVININSADQTLSLDPLNLNWNEAKAYGTALYNPNNNPSISGEMILEPTDLDLILKRLDPYYANSNESVANIIQSQLSYSFYLQDQLLDFTKLNLSLDDGAINGALKLKLSPPYKAEFNLIADNINFQPLVLLSGAIFPRLPTDSLLPVDLIKNSSILGKFSGSNIKLNDGFSINNLNSEIASQNGLMQINPFTISADNGTHNLSLYIDFNKPATFFKLNDNADNVDISSLIKLLKLPSIISGNSQLKISLESAGNSYNEILQNLNGMINIDDMRGNLYGFDMNKLMLFTSGLINDVYADQAKNKNVNILDILKPKVGKWQDDQKNSAMTAFDSLGFKAEISNGIAKSSLIINGANQDFNADGELNLINGQINYTGYVKNKNDIEESLDQINSTIKLSPLKILITGNVSKPIFNPDIQNYADQVIKDTEASLIKVAAGSMVAASPANDKTSQSAEDLFMGALKALSK